MAVSAPPAEADLALLLRIMAKAKTAAPLVEELLARVPAGWDRERLEDALAEAEVAGLVSPWPECPAGVAVLLTPLAAERLGLQLVGGESDLTTSGRFGLRWIPAGKLPRQRPPGAGGAGGPLATLESDLGLAEGESLDSIPDRRQIDHLERADALEWVAEQKRLAKAGPPTHILRGLVARRALKFIYLIGIRDIWSGEDFTSSICNSCGDRQLGEMEVCIRCNRSGLDFFLGSVPPKPKPPPHLQAKGSTKPKKPGKVARKQRRKAARQAS